jgi:hypothetical protein
MKNLHFIIFLSFSILSLCSLFVSFTNAGLVYSTYLGGSGEDWGNAIAVDAIGNIYIAGYTNSANFPTTVNAFDTSYNGAHDVFITKLNATGSALIYSTLLGGSNDDYGYYMAIDSAGDAYITGFTSSSDFPITTEAFDTIFNESTNNYWDVFITKLNPTGSLLLYSTYLGGSGQDYASGIAIDSSDNAYISGSTGSSDFPTTIGAFDSTYNGNDDVFVCKLNNIGSTLVYSTYLGGTAKEWNYGVALDNIGNVYVPGVTSSSDFPTTADAFDTTNRGGYDIFVSKINPSGTALIYSTYIGGGGIDYEFGIALDDIGNVYITGATYSDDFPTTFGAFDTSLNYSLYKVGAFVTKLNATGSSLIYSTFLGGSDDDAGHTLIIDSTGCANIIGITRSSDFPTTPKSVDESYNYTGSNLFDIFISKLNANGSELIYSTYLGGVQYEELGYSIAMDSASNIFLTGVTESKDFPITSNAFDSTYNGNGDVYITKLLPEPIMFNRHGAFRKSSDTTYWFFEKYDEGINAGTLFWIPNGCVHITQTPGEKGKLSQIFSVPSTGWYTSIAKVATDVTDISKQQKVYLYLQELDTNSTIRSCANQVIQSGAGGFSSAGVWKDMQVSFYAQNTLLGVQVVSINPTNSGITGSLYLDDIWVYAEGGQETTSVAITNSDFDQGTTNWSIQPYGDAYSAGVWAGWNGLLVGSQGPDEKGKISQLFNFASSGQPASGSVWVYSGATSMSETQKVYLYLYSYDSIYNKVIESGNAILQPGKWVPGQWYQLQFGCLPLTTKNAVQLVAINPANNPYQAIYFDDLVVKQGGL